MVRYRTVTPWSHERGGSNPSPSTRCDLIYTGLRGFDGAAEAGLPGRTAPRKGPKQKTPNPNCKPLNQRPRNAGLIPGTG